MFSFGDIMEGRSIEGWLTAALVGFLAGVYPAIRAA